MPCKLGDGSNIDLLPPYSDVYRLTRSKFVTMVFGTMAFGVGPFL